jgi:Ser/Thr protein kinase RdoA (MazF antagonist)
LTADERALLQAARARAARELATYGKAPGRYGMIHADLIRDNVLEDGMSLQAIDFDDSGFGWYMFELATIICANMNRADLPQLQEQLFAGYRAVRLLTQADLARLPLFLFLRASTYLGWVQTRSETQTAREMAPMHIERCCRLAREYLQTDEDQIDRGTA